MDNPYYHEVSHLVKILFLSYLIIKRLCKIKNVFASFFFFFVFPFNKERKSLHPPAEKKGINLHMTFINLTGCHYPNDWGFRKAHAS